MGFERNIKICRQNSLIGDLKLDCNVNASSVSIHYRDWLGKEGEVEGDDFFRLLGELREVYSQEGFLLMCTGSLIGVFPGGLTSESSHGELAYKFDEVTGDKEVVNIFDPLPLEDVHLISTLSEQKAKRMSVIKKFT